jgi:hypothetical protein
VSKVSKPSNVSKDLPMRTDRFVMTTVGYALAATLALTLVLAPSAQAQESQEPGTNVDALHVPFDKMLDIYVRDGFVYYRALRSERARFDRYVASLDVAPATYDRWPRPQQLAFWINAYNAFVLDTIIDHYPMRGRAAGYPPNSIRQIPGAFETIKHRAAGRSLTLDEIEKTVLAEFKEPRAFLALGRGSIGGGRLRSEAYTSARVDEQLADVAAECVQRKECIQIDESAGSVSVSPLFSWREAQFAEGLGQEELDTYPGRAPIERAVLRLVAPHILPTERAFLKQNQFTVKYGTYDWRLNDLTGGMPEREE